MNGTHGQDAAAGRAGRPDPFSMLTRKVLLLVDTDITALGHCRPAIRVLTEVAREVVVVATSTGRMGEVEGLGARVIDLDRLTFGSNLAQESLTAWRLARILEDENPDAVHLFGLEPVALGCMAIKLVGARHTIIHLPDLGPLEAANGALGWLHRNLVLKLMGSLASKPSSFLLVENSEDLALLRENGVVPGPRFAMLGGAGIDPDTFPVLPAAQNSIPVAAFIGRLTTTNGVDVLMRAFDRIWAKGVRLHLELYGERDPKDSTCVSQADLAQWALHPGVHIRTPEADVRELWRRADIFVLPARTRQGVPRALLEAAASGRPLVVSDVPGGRDFVRSGVEGFLVPAQDAVALGDALERLARDSDLRARMGEAARLRTLQSFTEAHVSETLKNVYRSLLGGAARQLASTV